jgi:protein NUD1
MNPLTLPFYSPFVSPPSALLPSHSEHQILHPDDDDAPSSPADWPAIDAKFRKSLPDDWYSKRATYRAVILQTVPSLLKLDGLLVAKERARGLARVASKLIKSRQ